MRLNQPRIITVRVRLTLIHGENYYRKDNVKRDNVAEESNEIEWETKERENLKTIDFPTNPKNTSCELNWIMTQGIRRKTR